jgi:S1-C subfamily serine protease
MHGDKEARSVKVPTFSPGALATGWVVLMVIARALARAGTGTTAEIIAASIAAFIPSFLCLVPVQNYVNAVSHQRNPGQPYYRWSSGHVVCLVLGIVNWGITIRVLLLLIGATINSPSSTNDIRQVSNGSKRTIAKSVAEDRANNRQKMIESVGEAVVTITTNTRSSGSGFILDQRTVVTNFHVIKGATMADVTLHNNLRTDVLGLWAAWPECDIAILSVSIPTAVYPAPLAIVNFPPKVGEEVFAFGSPLSLRGSVSNGIVSGVRVASEIDAAIRLGYHPTSQWIQTTAPVSAGNSGGPIVNSKGEVVGLATFVNWGGQNLNFAISSREINNLLRRPWYGKQSYPLDARPK